MSYNAAGPTADVRFVVQEWRDLADGRQAQPPTTIPNAPVIWPLSAGAQRGLTMGLKARDGDEPGDMVLVQWRHMSHDEFDKGAVAPLLPRSKRRQNAIDVVVLAGFVVPASGLPSGAFREDGQAVFSLPDDEALHIGDSEADLEVGLAQKILDRLDDIHGAVSGHSHSATGILDGLGAPCTGTTSPGAAYTAPTSVGTPRLLVDE